MEKSLMEILIVEDVNAVALSLSTILQGAGYNKITHAASAEEAFIRLGISGAQTQPRNIDLVLMDVVMPGINGTDACRFIKSFKLYQDLPIVMVAAKDEEELIFNAFEAGAVDYIVKPVNKLELIARVGSALRLKHEINRRKMWEQKFLEVKVQLNEAKQALDQMADKKINSCVSDSRSFNEIFRNEWEFAIQKESPISLLMINVGCYQEIKGQYGDACAEECMEMVNRALCEAMKRKRPGDFIARYGCGDFAVVLPTTDISGALTVAERIKSHVDTLEICHNKKNKDNNTLSVSIGVASTMPSETTTIKLLIAAADEALYNARQEGGNRIKMAAG